MYKRKSNSINANPEVKKQHVISQYGEPIYQIELSKTWLMIITTKAERFYFHIPEEISYWQIPNEREDTIEANEKLEELKDVTLLLVALIRGFVVTNDMPDNVNSCMEKLRQLFEENDTENAPEDDNLFSKGLQNDKTVDIEPGGLTVGYYSSSENEEDEGVGMENNNSEVGEESEGVQEAEDNEYGLNLSDLDDLLEISDTENDKNNGQEETLQELNFIYPDYKGQKSQLQFLKMLDRKQPDSFSSYDLEVDELCKEPEFIMVDDNNSRNELFDYWCGLQGKSNTEYDNLDEDNESESILDNSSDNEQDMQSNSIVDFINYLKNQEKIPSFYVDFKRKNRKNEEFTNLELPDKIKQTIYKRFLIFKRLDLNKKKEFLLDKISNLRKKELVSLKLNDIKSGNYDPFLELTFLNNSTEGKLREEIFKIIQNLL